MPFRSKVQQRKCYAMKAEGQAGSWDCDEFSEVTDFQTLPARAATEEKVMQKQAGIFGNWGQPPIAGEGAFEATSGVKGPGLTTFTGRGSTPGMAANNMRYGQPASPGHAPRPAAAAAALTKTRTGGMTANNARYAQPTGAGFRPPGVEAKKVPGTGVAANNANYAQPGAPGFRAPPTPISPASRNVRPAEPLRPGMVSGKGLAVNNANYAQPTGPGFGKAGNAVSRDLTSPTRASTKEKVMKKQAAGGVGLVPGSTAKPGAGSPGLGVLAAGAAGNAVGNVGRSLGTAVAPAAKAMGSIGRSVASNMPGMKSAKEAVIKMAAFIQYLGDKIPVGTKAADVGRNQARVHQLHKLAFQLKRTGNLITAVNLCYQDKSAAYRHQVVQGLVQGLLGKVKQAQQLKQAKASCGMTKHPSGGIDANTAATPKSKVQTTGSISTSEAIKASSALPGPGPGAGIQQGLDMAGGAAQQAVDPEQQKAMLALLAISGIGGSAGMGAALGGAAGTVAGAERGNTPEGLGRGIIRGGATGAGAGLGALGGSAAAQGMGQDSTMGGLLGAGLGAGAGYLGSGALLGKPQG